MNYREKAKQIIRELNLEPVDTKHLLRDRLEAELDVAHLKGCIEGVKNMSEMIQDGE